MFKQKYKQSRKFHASPATVPGGIQFGGEKMELVNRIDVDVVKRIHTKNIKLLHGRAIW